MGDFGCLANSSGWFWTVFQQIANSKENSGPASSMIYFQYDSSLYMISYGTVHVGTVKWGGIFKNQKDLKPFDLRQNEFFTPCVYFSGHLTLGL